MKQFKCLLFVLPLIFLTGITLAQKKVTGKVVDQATGEPLSGVTILADKKKGGITSQKDGTYSISIDPAVSATILFSHVGYIAKLIPVEGHAVINVALVSSATLEDEVVVIGYGTIKKSSVTGAVSKYQNENLAEIPSSRLDQALQGKIAGVQIQNVSSEAGSDPQINVRGITSINAGSSPLVVVDGHPVPDGLSFVNMADVASVEVLKDAASSAIYGSRGGSGVIMITTKSGKANKPKYSLTYTNGLKQPYKLYPMMTVTEYTKMLYAEAALKAQDPSVPAPTPATTATTAEKGAYIIENDLRGGVSTDWQNEAIRDANVQNLQLSVSGGNSGLKYYLSGGYQNDQGMMYHSEYQRFNLRSKITAQLGKKVQLNLNINPSYITRERPSTGYIDFVRFQSYLPVYLDETLAAFVRQDPAYSNVKAGDFAQAYYFNNRVYNGLMPDGSTWVNTSNITPFNTANNTPKSVMETRTINSSDFRTLSSGDLTYKIMPGLEFKTMGSLYVIYTDGLDFAKSNSNRAGDVNKGVYTSRLFIDLLNENTLNYTKQIRDHSFNVLAGFTAQKTILKNEQITGLNYPSDNITTLNTALTVDQDRANTFNTKTQRGLLSYLGRVIYDYKSKYLFSASYRMDGSSYFAQGHKWGKFPSVSLGWVASKEKFMQKVDWISNLKLRGSYGVTGNNRIFDYAYISLLNAANYPFGGGTGTAASGQAPLRDILPNEEITWERTFQYNGGLDVSLFHNILTFSLDVYQSKTDQLLLQQAAMGFTGVPFSWNNIGSLRNNGIEFEFTSNNIRTKKFKWTTSGNIAHNKNKISELGSEAFLLNQGERTELYMNKVGGPLVQFYGYKTDGVWLSQKEIDDAKAKGLTSNLTNMFVPGGLKLIDINGDKVIDINDRTVIGNPYPEYTWGITNNFTYKNFDASFFIQGVQGGSLVNGDPNYNETKRYNKNYNTNRWISPMFPGDGKTPYSTIGFNWMLTDYVVEDASYFALREVMAGYTFPEKWMKKAKVTSLRIFFSAQNLYFHSAAGYRGINAEGRYSSGPYSSPLLAGYQRGSFPMAKTYQFGVNLNF